MTTKSRGHKHTLQIEDILLVIQWNGEFAFEISNRINTDKLNRFKEKYAEEIAEFKKLSKI